MGDAVCDGMAEADCDGVADAVDDAVGVGRAVAVFVGALVLVGTALGLAVGSRETVRVVVLGGGVCVAVGVLSATAVIVAVELAAVRA